MYNPASYLSCIRPELHLFCPVFHLSVISPTLYSTCPASHLSCIPPLCHLSCPASLLSCITPVHIPPVLHPDCPASLLSCITPVLHHKIAKVVPIHKSGAKDLMDNYRPISLLCTFSKILEKIMYNRLSDFLETNNLLSPQQFGFRKSHSTVHPLTLFVNQISNALNKKNHAIAIFCDIKKAFDTVQHPILLKKLYNMGIRGTELLWFQDYLCNRKQYVSVNGVNSYLSNILFGVPQGSILGPILFLIYINDLPKCSSLFTSLFADDTKLVATGPDLPLLIQQVNCEFQKINYFFRSLKLSLHPSKTKFMIFTNNTALKHLDLKIYLNNNNFDQNNSDLLIPIEQINSLSPVPAIKFLEFLLTLNSTLKIFCQNGG